MKKSYEKLIWVMYFLQLVLGKCVLEFVHFGQKYIWEMSILENPVEIITVNQC